MEEYKINCTGDVVAGDEIVFTEGVFKWNFKKSTFLGERKVFAKVLKESYGSQKQQHTFTLEVINSEGTQPIQKGSKILRKGRNIYQNLTLRKPWDDELLRISACEEKHNRGNKARKKRDERRMGYESV